MFKHIIGVFKLDSQTFETIEKDTSLTGTALQYGTAGYEFTISDVPTATQGSFWIRLVDQANLPLSGRIPFDTFAECEKNLTIINFKQVR